VRGSGSPAQPGIFKRVRRGGSPGSISLTFTCRILDRPFDVALEDRRSEERFGAKQHHVIAQSGRCGA
jgi:hypothetical protein